MILTGNEIEKEYEKGNIHLEPFIKENIAINSIDVRLSKYLVTYYPVKILKLENGKNLLIKDKEKIKTMKNYIKEIDDIYISMRQDNETFECEIPEDGLIITPEILFLGSTMEKAGSDKFIPMYEGRSSMGRLGIESHISAGFGDLGFKSNWTLEITVVHPLEIFAETRIGQVYFIKGDEEEIKIALENGFVYKGKYTQQEKPQASKAFIDNQ